MSCVPNIPVRVAQNSSLRPVLDTALDPVVVMRTDGTVADWNDCAERSFGWTRDEALGRHLAELIIPDEHREAHEQGLARYLQTGRSRVLHQRIEITAVHKDGHALPVELSITEADDGGERVFVGFLRDIGDRRRTERQLERRARETDLLFRVTALAAETDSFEDALRACLGAVCELTGWPVGHAFKTSDTDSRELQPTMVWHHNGDDRFQALRNATSRIRFSTGVGLPGQILKTGDPAWIADIDRNASFIRSAIVKEIGVRAAFGFPIKSGGHVIAVLEFFSETPAEPDEDLLRMVRSLGEQVGRVLERKRMQDALREGDLRLRLALASARMAAWEYDPVGDTLKPSPELNRLLGLPDDALADMQAIRERYHPDDRDRLRTAGWSAYERGEKQFQVEFRCRLDDGAIVWFMLRAEFLPVPGRKLPNVLGVILDITDRKRTEEHQRLLISELNHRVKNTLAVVQGVVGQSLRSPEVPVGVQQTLEGRLAALAAAHNVLTREGWSAASLGEIIGIAVAPFASPPESRFDIEGPDLRIAPKTAVSLSMALHELCTNASKYGALSSDAGRVSITWRVSRNEEPPRLLLQWIERGGPKVESPARRGFGSRMIEKGLAAELGGKVLLDFLPEGVMCSIDAPLPQADVEA